MKQNIINQSISFLLIVGLTCMWLSDFDLYTCSVVECCASGKNLKQTPGFVERFESLDKVRNYAPKKFGKETFCL